MEGRGRTNIYVRESQLNTAWDGDRVLVKVPRKGVAAAGPEGEVQLILGKGKKIFFFFRLGAGGGGGLRGEARRQ